MEFISLLLIIIILVIVINFKTNTSEKLSSLQSQIKELNRITNSLTPPSKPTEEQVLVQPEIICPPPIIIEEKVEPFAQEDYWKSSFEIIDNNKKTYNSIENNEAVKPIEKEASSKFETLLQQSLTRPHTPTTKPNFFERNPDLEKFIGENLISKIGIGILVLAIGFFVKYAIDNNWIGEVGRVGIGLLCGGILVGLAYRLRNGYKSFSSVLVGGGLAVFYFTITLAYHNFHLFSQSTSFIIMIVITAFAVIISLLYDRQELAIISLIGGFSSPFLVSDGSGNYQSLFIYLIILNTGLLIIAYNKAWRLLNILAFIFTVLIFGGWLLLGADNNTVTYKNGFIYATCFYLLFFAINIAHNIKENKKFIASDFGILLANTSLYFSAGLYCIIYMQGEQYKGLFSSSMGIFNLAASYFLFKNRKVDTNILYLLIAITLTFISLTAPLQLSGNYITLFWASETVLLFWLYQKSKISIFQLSSFIIWIAMLISLIMDWFNVYNDTELFTSIIFNRGFITTIYAAIASYIVFGLIKNQSKEHSTTWLPKNSFRITALLLLFISGALEIHFQFTHYYPLTQLNLLYLLLYSIVFVWIFIFITNKIQSLQLGELTRFVLLSICILYYFLSISVSYNVQAMILIKHQDTLHYAAHWFTALFTALILYQLIFLSKNYNEKGNSLDVLSWLLCAVMVAFLSIEIHLLTNRIFYSTSNTLETIERVYLKTGLPILWGICSFIFMWFGMKHKYRPLRIISLTLFSITLLKLFLFDISNIPIAGKIAAFFSLGVLLLVVSFMYQRLKKIIIEDEKIEV